MQQVHITADDKLMADIRKIAADGGISQKNVIEDAMRFYVDAKFCRTEVKFLNDNVLACMQATVDSLEHKLNNRTNQVLSELAIEEAIVVQMLAYSLDVKGDAVAEYRKHAIEFLKVNQRVLRLDEQIR